MTLPSRLIYSTDADSGYSRRGAGTGYAYYDSEGALVTCRKLKKRLNGLAIPPAYRDVWYCADEWGHLQATGVDARGRKQYRYHADWTAWRESQKFNSLRDLARALPKVRCAVQRELAEEGLEKDRVVAAVVRLLDKTAARIGNETYYEENGTAGLTTLRCRHVEVEEGHVHLDYMAKGGEEREFDLYQPTLSGIVDKLQDLPGQRLFQYEARGEWCPVSSSDVNEWLKKTSEMDISAKDFRTWHASRMTLSSLMKCPKTQKKSELKKQEMAALRATSRELGHRPPVCRKHYVHPEILRAHRDNTLERLDTGSCPTGLRAEEDRLTTFLTEIDPLTIGKG